MIASDPNNAEYFLAKGKFLLIDSDAKSTDIAPALAAVDHALKLNSQLEFAYLFKVREVNLISQQLC